MGSSRGPRLAAFSTTSRTLTSADLRGWNPSPDRGVAGLAVSDSTVYAARSFDEVGGETRVHLAAIDRSSGAPTDWNPSADGVPETLALSGSTVYVGGQLASVGGDPEVAALDPGTGS